MERSNPGRKEHQFFFFFKEGFPIFFTASYCLGHLIKLEAGRALNIEQWFVQKGPGFLFYSFYQFKSYDMFHECYSSFP